MKNFKTTMMGAAAIAALALVGCSEQPTNQYTITGNLQGIADSTILVLDPVSHEAEKPMAEFMVIDGKFTITDTISEPRAVWLKLKDGYEGSISLMLEPGQIKVDGSLRDATVTGSALTEKYQSLLATRDALDEIYIANKKRFEPIQEAVEEARKNKDQKKVKELLQSDEYQAMLKADKEFFDNVDATYDKLFMDNKDSFWGPLMMISLTSYFTDDMKKTYEALSQEAKDSYYGKKVKNELYPAGKEGTKVPEFTVTDNNGKSITLAELCQGKKYILIDFWASWCNPCRKEIPNLKKIYKEYADKGFQIISISIDKKKADWEKALKEENLEWPNFLDNGDVAIAYKVKMIPTMYLIDTNGVMVGEDLRGEALAEKIGQLLK